MRVLLALDLSPSSDALVDRAIAWTQRVGGSLHLRSVSALLGDAQAIAGSLETSFVAKDWEARRRWERQRMEQLSERIPKELRGTTGILEGFPTQVLVELSSVSDLLILGTHGRTGLRKLFLGSVAEAVCRSAECPVLVMPLGEDGEPPAIPEGDLTVFCPVDIEEVDLRAAHWVRDHMGGVRYELAHALRYAPWLARDLGAEPQLSDHPDARRAHSMLDDLAAANELGMSRAHLALSDTDNPGSRLAAQAEELGAQLIAMPTHGRKGMARLVLGSVAARVLQEASCSVLIVR